MTNKPKKKPVQAKESNKIVLVNLLAVLRDGSVIPLDITKVTLIDNDTGNPIFKTKGKK